MSKLIGLHQTMIVEDAFRETKVLGTVTNSNYLETGVKHKFPIHPEVSPLISKGDNLRVTLFTYQDDYSQEGTKINFSSRGVRYEVLDEKTNLWTKIFEYMRPAEAS